MIRKSILTLCAFALVLPTAAFAAKGEKKGKKGNREALMAAKGYDANSNGMIDGDEVAAIQKAYEADKNGALKSFDTNADGKLDATEVGAIKGGGKKKKKNK